MAGGQQAQQNQSEAHHSPYLWILIGLTALVIAGWHFGHAYIVQLVFWVKTAEIALIGLIAPEAAESMRSFVENTPVGGVSFSQLVGLCVQVGDYLRYPVTLFLLIAAGAIYFLQPNARFRSIYDMEALVKAEQVNWPLLTPVVDEKLVGTNCEEGPWAMAMTPLQFAQHHQLIKVTKQSMREDQLAREVGYRLNLDRAGAARVFSLQLGRLWTSPDDLAPHAKALFAIFAAKAYRDREGARRLLNQLAVSSLTGLDYTGIDETLNKYRNEPGVVRACQGHAFEMTVMFEMIQLARLDGVLASAEFLWLKKVDRKLWYVLNTAGRQTAVPEVSGVFAHWRAERMVGRPLRMPMVHQAIRALDMALQEVKYTPPEDSHA